MVAMIMCAILMIVMEIIDQEMGGLLDQHLAIIPQSNLNQLAIGIIFAPFSHGDINHLSGNLVAYFPLSILLILKGEDFLRLWLVLSVGAGIGVWLIGHPESAHIGASGVIFGQWSYLLAGGLFHRDFNSILSAALCAVWLGRMYFSLINTAPGISWEGHASGVIAGAVAALFFKEFCQCSKKSKALSLR